MTKSLKRNFLAFATVASASTLAIAASCGNSTKGTSSGSVVSVKSKQFDQELSEKIRVGVTWSNTGAQYKGLQEIVDVYNANINTIYPDGGAKQVELKGLGSGYGEGAEKVKLSLESQDKNQFFHLTFNYSVVAANLAEYDMLLDFDDEDSSSRLDINTFESQFTSENTNTEYISVDGTYVLPVAKSTAVLSFNTPVFSYLVDKMKEAGATTDAEFETWYASVKEKGQADRDAVAKIWGERNKKSLEGYTIKKSMFDSYEDLFDFAIKAQSLFDKATSWNEGEKLHVFGIDDPAGFFETVVTADLNANESESIARRIKVNGVNTISFDALRTNQSPAYLSGQKIYNKTKEAVKSGALKLQGSGEYSSTTQIYHKMAFSIGSTAGYSKNYVSGSSVNRFDSKLDQNFSFDEKYDDNSKNIMTIVNSNDKYAEIQDQVLFYVGKYKNPVFKAGVKDNPAYAKHLSKYDFYAKDEAQVEKIKAALMRKTANTRFVYLFKDESTKPNAQLMEKINAIGSEVNSNNVYLGEFEDNKYGFLVLEGTLDKVKELAASLGMEFKVLSSTDILNQNELVAEKNPEKWEQSDAKKVVYVQGPSLMGIHSNTVDNEATRKFVKWLVTSDAVYTFGKGEYAVEETPIKHFQRALSYIAPIDFAHYDESVFGEGKKANEYLKVALKSFKEAQEDPNAYATYSTPGAIKANLFRDALTTSFKALQDEAKTKKGNIDLEYSKLVDTLNESLK
ncbi:P68 family surface lipoprotein [Mycoplasmopsis gallinacea]|uniref:Uncharacterized lipoprotein MPN_097 n=1 Tax=Mycoplasmopsis gallinacea TaxID=29556 RepID=A0A449A3X3_9BACT|nr:P80 family lipoprotein [Mycoplasmopsis gallinacea]VEU58873.1 Uncharacterized lipoprotein MPN_097 precursor [Mycoplasmopsis gallinacea]